MRTPIPDALTLQNQLTGTAALDLCESIELEEFAKECGIDTQKWFPVAFEMFGIHLGALVFYAVDRSLCGQSLQDIEDYADGSDRPLPVHRLEAQRCPLDWDRYIKRFHVVLKSEVIRERDVTVTSKASGAA